MSWLRLVSQTSVWCVLVQLPYRHSSSRRRDVVRGLRSREVEIRLYCRVQTPARHTVYFIHTTRGD